MNFRHLIPLAIFSLLLISGGAFGFSEIDEIESQLTAQREVIEKDRKALNLDCDTVPSTNATKVAACKQRYDDVILRMDKYKADFRKLGIIKEAIAGERDFFYSIAQDEIRIPVGIKLLAKKLGWSTEKQARLEKALKDLGFDGLDPITAENVRAGWSAIAETANNVNLAKAAGKQRLATVGQQEKMDCAAAAMATAAGLRYDDVAAHAKELIRQGEWRHDIYRENPQDALKNGLTGGEVVLLAESLGRAEVVPQSRFEETLKSGRPVMVNVATASSKSSPQGGMTTVFGDHQIVLTKTFQHKGKTWYEMADPNSPDTRYFVTPEKLNLILQEKGIAFRRNP